MHFSIRKITATLKTYPTLLDFDGAINLLRLNVYYLKHYIFLLKKQHLFHRRTGSVMIETIQY